MAKGAPDRHNRLSHDCERNANGRDLPANRVQETTLWLVDGDDYIGRIALRETRQRRVNGEHL